MSVSIDDLRSTLMAKGLSESASGTKVWVDVSADPEANACPTSFKPNSRRSVALDPDNTYCSFFEPHGTMKVPRVSGPLPHSLVISSRLTEMPTFLDAHWPPTTAGQKVPSVIWVASAETLKDGTNTARTRLQEFATHLVAKESHGYTAAGKFGILVGGLEDQPELKSKLMNEGKALCDRMGDHSIDFRCVLGSTGKEDSACEITSEGNDEMPLDGYEWSELV